ncbi:phosphotransferase [Catenuloplanes indicus]|uniref:Aminoglycoside phosphotransferase (APT) family kinase protein n=1 Tax=Catenuloplanes indicus TaxID=137267 RepID=A0AAE4B1N2_9ACTN|nr:phosphotransferase [Catenuloplanes indicus]MDQ0370787.1 aminoglycoside phosphotransferase (APT) family kinase protein [Catenuloplanes indicus]
MLAEPPDLDRADVAAALHRGWGLTVAALDYAPLGYGAHHYRARDTGGAEWFLGVALDPDVAALERAFGTAAALREAGLDFVAAPLRRPDGRCVTVTAGGAAVSVTELIDGRSHGFGDVLPAPVRAELRSALDRMHASPVPPGAPVDSLAVPYRDELDGPWSDGPYARRTRSLLISRTAFLEDLFARYDALVPVVTAERAAWVVTHGEPHPGNVMLPAGGGLRLIDWDTVAVAPRERDLWMVAPDDSPAAALYRLRRTLTDICAFVRELRGPHVDDEDTRLAWRELSGYLAPAI